MKKLVAIFLIAFSFGCENSQNNIEQMINANESIFFVGTYTQKEGHVDGQGEGVYVYSMNKETGAISYMATSDFVNSPSYLAVHPNGKNVYAVNEFDGGEDGFATVSSFEFDLNQIKYSTSYYWTKSFFKIKVPKENKRDYWFLFYLLCPLCLL